MIAVWPWLFCFFVSTMHRAMSVRIFNNINPKPLPTRNIPFEPRVISETCKLKPERGPCRAGIQMYFFNVTTNECGTFSWGGCQGNGNRFDTEEECTDKCLSKEGVRRQAPKYCGLTYDYGYCFGAAPRWYFDNVWKTCKETIYSGCGGNDNNFLYREQCEAICLFRKGPYNVQGTTKSGPQKVIIINPVESIPGSIQGETKTENPLGINSLGPVIPTVVVSSGNIQVNSALNKI